ncbi:MULTISPECIES: C40 family peptidase [Pseudofrankia]|uniref:C40 family peptidase n=1 Tax=Pseudofrankia TaxID=2994363 RepID=UPI000234BE7F|nr:MULTISPECIES: NlpC/P60 family protein [Pseudofrankia]
MPAPYSDRPSADEAWSQHGHRPRRPPAETVRRSTGWAFRLTRRQNRVAAIAALTTSGLAVSTASFAATVTTTGSDIGPVDSAPVTQAAMFGAGAGAGAAPAAERAPDSLAAALADPIPDFTTTTIEAEKSAIAPNAEARFTIHVRDATTGAPVAGENVNVVVVAGTRWSRSATLRTDDEGMARIGARLLSTTTVTAVFDGGASLRPSVAAAATVTVTSPTPTRPTGVAAIPGSTIGAKAVYLASLQRGKPYVWGATGPYAFDCSGFSQYVYKQLGRYLPRTAQQQFEATLRVPQSAKQPGDLLFFGSPDNITHMAIYAGNGYMWAAPQTGDVVKLEPIYTSTYWVGRVL